jgi:hypothetical protein
VTDNKVPFAVLFDSVGCLERSVHFTRINTELSLSQQALSLPSI